MLIGAWIDIQLSDLTWQTCIIAMALFARSLTVCHIKRLVADTDTVGMVTPTADVTLSARVLILTQSA